MATLKSKMRGRDKISQTDFWRRCSTSSRYFTICQERIRPKAKRTTDISACSGIKHVHALNETFLPHILFHYPVFALLAKRAHPGPCPSQQVKKAATNLATDAILSRSCHCSTSAFKHTPSFSPVRNTGNVSRGACLRRFYKGCSDGVSIRAIRRPQAQAARLGTGSASPPGSVMAGARALT